MLSWQNPARSIRFSSRNSWQVFIAISLSTLLTLTPRFSCRYIFTNHKDEKSHNQSILVTLGHTKPWLFQVAPNTWKFRKAPKPGGQLVAHAPGLVSLPIACAFVRAWQSKCSYKAGSQTNTASSQKSGMSLNFGSHILSLRDGIESEHPLQFYITPEPQCHTIRNRIWNHILRHAPVPRKLTWHRTWLGT